MQTHSIKLSPNFINILLRFPETGMGYQSVKVILKDGRILHHYKVLNSELLIMEGNEVFTDNDIDVIEPEKG